MTLTHGNTNNGADSSGDITSTDVKHHDGLTDLGREVVREMNRVGMIVEIPHVSDKTFWDALESRKRLRCSLPTPPALRSQIFRGT